ncbi:MAG: competence/damage-inducible protein A [Nannocystaceae bacterium]|nr:competence/damage-inducible protein A [Nannocystaceae bacterium]
MPTPVPPTASLLLIGDELLSGKIRDENGHHLAKALRRLGIAFVEMVVVGDREAAIGEALLRLCERADLVFTSGGVGPTHDDITMASIAAATGRKLQQHPEMAVSLRTHYGDNLTDAALAMADVPEGTVLRGSRGWPVLRLDLDRPTDPATSRIYILPGVPSLFRSKIEHLEAQEGELPRGQGWHLALLHTTLDESELAPHLDALLAKFGAPRGPLEIGSYPRWARADDGSVDYHVRITFEAPRAAAALADQARDELASVLGSAALCEASSPL